tara:strand:+ start:822 stop:1220 length:399 start_codon:yes stop_codon:yes gene_type:complete
MKIGKKSANYLDERGSITDIIDSLNFNGATIIESKLGCVRGNHYHKKTIQYVYVISGKMKSTAKKINEAVEVAIVGPGDLISHKAYEAHNFEALENTTFLVLSSGLRSGKDYELDTYRLNSSVENFSDADIS